ncbi:hypothetical protein ACLOJK_003808 [Asimina triloba]
MLWPNPQVRCKHTRNSRTVASRPASVTAYSPLRPFYGLKSGLKGGILGLGGVGHVAVKVAKAMGHHVTVISASERKRFQALEHLGADDFLVSSNLAQIARAGESLDYILAGAIHSISTFHWRRTITGSFVGSIEETQELLNLWAEKGLSCMIEIVKMDYIHTAMERMERGDVRYRFVLDVAGSNL